MSNQHAIVLPHGRVLLQEVPEFTTHDDESFFYKQGLKSMIPSANWQLIGITPLTEEQALNLGIDKKFFTERGISTPESMEEFHAKGFGKRGANILLTANNIDQSKRWVVLLSPK